MKKSNFENGRYVIEDFAAKPPFTNFLPGIAGLGGRPVWAFYVSRGQGIAGFGVGGKDHPIMEFFPAETAYARAPLQGFRTLLRIDGVAAEPFRAGSGEKSSMEVCRYGFSIEERSARYRFRAEYFGVPNRDYAALGRIISYTNETEKTQEVEMLDGLAQMLPYGIGNGEFKEAGNLFKSWMVAEGTGEGFAYIRMRASTADCAEVKAVKGGNFFLPVGGLVVVDPDLVFGSDRTMVTAERFFQKGIGGQDISSQRCENELFCAFAHRTLRVPPHETVLLCSLYGYADTLDKVRNLKKNLTVEEVLCMRQEAVGIVEDIAAKVETHTAYPVFDAYIKQCYFDNVLRGGLPVEVGKRPVYVYSRKHGDPERDYNCFSIAPTPYSSGRGNFRDVVQNRRSDVLITPSCGDLNIRYFFSLLQADGYDPLSVGEIRYTCSDVPAKYSEYSAFLQGKFTVGEAAERLGIGKEALGELIAGCQPSFEADFAEGYWTDHFVYLVDLLLSYLAVFPEREREILFETPLRYFVSEARLLPYQKRAILTPRGRVCRANALEKTGKKGWLKAGEEDFETCLAAKLLFLALIKTATLDPMGCGIDMEAGKPGWCDAANGLPSLFGSNVADGLELLRLIRILRTLTWGKEDEVEWAAEQDILFHKVLNLLRENIDPQEFYLKANAVKDTYLKSAYAGFGTERVKVAKCEAEEFYGLAERKLLCGMERARALGGGRMPTYLVFDVTKFERAGEDIVPTQFVPRALPHFAEGVAKSLALGDADEYFKAKNSPLYDREFGFFLTSEPLEGESIAIGRIRSFPKGWLERESCFLHMQYKVLLSMLKCGLYEEFYEEIKTGLVPFMDPEKYGRSILENSSFIVPSGHSDEKKRGKGYQARLTGANAEAISMWLCIMGAERPFILEGGVLKLHLEPRLHRDFFDENGRVSFTLLGKIKIEYVNQTGKNTWDGVKVTSYRLQGEDVIETKEVAGELAEKVRGGKYQKIEVYLG